MTPEDEAFNEIEKRSKVKQEILQNLHDENKRLGLYEQVEPVAWMDEDGDVLSASVVDGTGLRNIPLYITPQQRTWVGLTDEEVSTLWGEWKDAVCLDYKTWAEAIEAKLKEKNA
jgi:hypothetical protein